MPCSLPSRDARGGTVEYRASSQSERRCTRWRLMGHPASPSPGNTTAFQTSSAFATRKLAEGAEAAYLFGTSIPCALIETDLSGRN